MSWLNRLLNVFRGGRLNSEIEEELQFHLEARIRDGLEAGMTPEQARRSAALHVGNTTLQAERIREADAIAWLETAAQDVRFAARMFRRHPAFAFMAVMLLGLGIGVSSSMFSLLMATIYRQDPFAAAARLVYFFRHDEPSGGFEYRLPYADAVAVGEQTRSLEHLAIYRPARFLVNARQGPRYINGYQVQASWLSALGTQPALGRNFLAEEEQPGRGDVVILSDTLWKRMFNRQPAVIGSRITVEDSSFTIVGVLPPEFTFENAEMLAPLVPDEKTRDWGTFCCFGIANLRGGVSLAEAQTEIDSIIHHLVGHRTRGIRLATPAMKMAYDCGPTCGQAHRGIWLLFGAVGLVMLMACANVSNLLLTRAMGRRREFLVRTAIGCSRLRLIRQIVTESLLLFVCGGALGIVVAMWSDTLLANIAASYTDGVPIGFDGRALAFSAAVTLISGLVFGLIPALRSASITVEGGLHETSGAIAGSARGGRTRRVLIALEFGFALVLLAGFGLLLRSFLRVESAPTGFRTGLLLTASTTLSSGRYKEPRQRIALTRRLLDKIRALPAVASAALTSDLPLTGAGEARIRIDGITPADPRGDSVRYISVSGGFFSTLEIPILAGRPLLERDSETAAPVVVINHTMARQFFQDASPIGRRIQMQEQPRLWREIVGVAGEVKQRNLEEDSRPIFYRPYLQGLDTDLRRPVVRLLASFAVLAVILTATGLYSVLSCSVTERTREIGIRMALGARRSQVLRRIAVETLCLALPGTICGAAASFLLARLLPSGHIGWSGSGVFLYGVSPTDAVTYASVAAALCLMGILAGLSPARRAMRVDPAVALRHE